MPKVAEEYYVKKREEIIEAAYRVCVKKPISSVDMKDIISETGFSHGVIYRYYKELDEILRDLVISINEKNRIDERLDSIMEKAEEKNWKKTIREIFQMLSDYITRAGVDVLKISLYSDMLAMGDPERAAKIAERLGKENKSPLFYLTAVMSRFLKKIIKQEDLNPSHSADEIIQFIVVTYQGIQSGYVLAECYKSPQLKNKYKPKKMFACLAESIISMLENKDE